MTTIVPLSAKSAYGLASGRLEAGMFLGVGAGLGKDFVAFGTMRKVDAGATIFLGTGLGVFAV